MKLTRYYFIGEDLDDLERFEEELESGGIVTPQVHILTRDDRGVASHAHLHQVTPFMQKDVVHSTLIGAAIGVCMAVLVLLVTYLAGWHETAAGWVPFVFLAVIMLGFCTWQGGLWGIQTTNVHFKRFGKALKEGKHVFFVDLEPGRGKLLKDIANKHPTLAMAGLDRGAPSWIVFSQYHLKRFFTETFP